MLGVTPRITVRVATATHSAFSVRDIYSAIFEKEFSCNCCKHLVVNQNENVDSLKLMEKNVLKVKHVLKLDF